MKVATGVSEPVWISHRGLSQQYDENSAPAFRAACEAGFTWLETDLHCTGDGHVVLSHDRKLDRVAPVSGTIAAMTRVELEKVRLRKGGRFLFLDEFMAEFSGQKWVFDIKPDTALATMTIVAGLLREDPELTGRIIFLFWERTIQKKFLAEFPEAVCFPDEGRCYRAGLASLLGVPLLGGIEEGMIYSIIPVLYGVPLLSSRLVERFHERGAKVLGYLPADLQQARLCLDAGVDFILSNHPPVTGR